MLRSPRPPYQKDTGKELDKVNIVTGKQQLVFRTILINGEQVYSSLLQKTA